MYLVELMDGSEQTNTQTRRKDRKPAGETFQRLGSSIINGDDTPHLH